MAGGVRVAKLKPFGGVSSPSTPPAAGDEAPCVPR